ncbi:MAG TPA: DUF1156 domain-containing protein [Acidobacteriota bacterium]|nr:DUF1156 domain-containing protein [Acidobacteriota bacterium]
MIPKECKRLAEVDFPIAVVSKHSAREKSIRHGHPSTLHLWWARRPLAACRAMLMALLLPDPCDSLCPKEFEEQARELLPKVQGEVGMKDMDLRHALLKFIGDFSNWDFSSHPAYLEVGRGLVKAAHPEETPLVVDPFAGGGSIPLEALRLGCDAFASDLNPVACLVLKVMLEDIPRHGAELADELRKAGAEIKKQAEKELAEFYPDDPDGSKPIAYLWARTVRCEAPDCGAEIPLMRSFWLCKKANRRRALKSQVRRFKEKGRQPEIEFEIFEPKKESEVEGGTVARAKAKCLCCGTVLQPERVRAQLSQQKGGADVIFDKEGKRTGGARMLAVVTLKEGQQGRNYRLPQKGDYEAVWKAKQKLDKILSDWEKGGKKGLCPVPDEELPTTSSGFMAPPIYGMTCWSDLFSSRQNMALLKHVEWVSSLSSRNQRLTSLLALAVSRLADIQNSLCSWKPSMSQVIHVFTRQAIPMMWDFAEANPLGQQAGDLSTTISNLARIPESLPTISHYGQVCSMSADDHSLPDESVGVWFTDPPYYSAVPYADISDFFFVWLKRILADNAALMRDSDDLANALTPKKHEICEMAFWDSNRYPEKDKGFFEDRMASAFAEGRRELREDCIGSVVFAHKSTEGWEALLNGMTKGGWTITGSWPIATEMANRLRARDSAALATSVHLVCRPRPDDAPVGDWSEVLRELPKRVGDWMERLQSEGVHGADLVFACIGPALEIFSRYSKVETAEGKEVGLAVYLEKVWEVVGRSALEQVLGTAEARARNGMAGALEEDARLTALFLWTLQSTEQDQKEKSDAKQMMDDESEEDDAADDDDEKPGKSKGKGFSLVFDVVRRFAQPLGIELPKWESRVIETEKGVVRLFGVSERANFLFGSGSADAAAEWILENPSKSLQRSLFKEEEGPEPTKIRTRKAGRKSAGVSIDSTREIGYTTLDRVHMAMLFQGSGQTTALRELIKAEQERGEDFLRLSNALSALYPKNSEEKRLVDAMLLAVPK